MVRTKEKEGTRPVGGNHVFSGGPKGGKKTRGTFVYKKGGSKGGKTHPGFQTREQKKGSSAMEKANYVKEGQSGVTLKNA